MSALRPIPLCRPWMEETEFDAVTQVLESGFLVQGPRVEAFERKLSECVGAPAVACSSGTAALWLALAAWDIGPGDEVVVPASTFPAPIHAAVLRGARVVPVDVAADTWGLDPEGVAAACTPRTRAVIAVHPFGMVVDVPAIARAAREATESKVPPVIVEDAACALGASLGGTACGALGDVGCFSFHPRKIVTTGEGGAVVSADAARLRRARALRQHGAPGRVREGSDFEEPGWNLRMSDVHAAIGLGQLDRLARAIEARSGLAAVYRSGLETLGFELPPALGRPGSVVQTLVALVPPRVDRDALRQALAERRVESTIAAWSISSLGWFRAQSASPPGHWPMAERIDRRAIALPLYPQMSRADVEAVLERIEDAL